MSGESKRDLNREIQKVPKWHRSPNYPRLGFRVALERAEQIYRHFKGDWASVEAAYDVWGYGSRSSVGEQVVAALKAYGLLEMGPESPNRQLRVSERGCLITQNDETRPRLLKEAVLLPRMNSILWRKFGQGGLPSDEDLKIYLTKTWNFNPTWVAVYVLQFREALEFAGFVPTDPPPEMKGKQIAYVKGREEAAAMRDEMMASSPLIAFDLPRGNRLEISLRAKVSAKEFEIIKQIYALSELSFVEDRDGRGIELGGVERGRGGNDGE